MTQIPPNLHKPHDNLTWWLLRRIWNQVNRKNEHFMGVIVGREGSGKSHTAIRICTELDPEFTADRVIFDVIDLLEILKDGEHTPGDFYCLDEAGVQLGRRTWQERSQVLANQALQLIRNHNLGLIFTLPRMSELDSQTEGRLHASYEITNKVDGEYVMGKWKWMKPDRINPNGPVRTPFPETRVNGYKRKLKGIGFKPITGDIIEGYEQLKTDFQEAFYEQTIQENRAENEDAEELEPKEVAERVLDGGLPDVISEHGTTGKPYINKELIRVEYGLTEMDARAVKALLKRELNSKETPPGEESGAGRVATQSL